MIDLVVCEQCRRHVAEHERACPFCAAALPRVSRVPERLVGRVSRAAVFATLTACGSSPPPAQTAPLESPPPPPPQTQPVDAALAEPTPPDAAPPARGSAVVAPSQQRVFSGSVTDGNGTTIIAYAEVSLVDDKGVVIASATTDTNGHYEMLDVKPGDYQLHVNYSSQKAVGKAKQRVKIGTAREQEQNVVVKLVYRAAIPKPYGAPPARRRIV